MHGYPHPFPDPPRTGRNPYTASVPDSADVDLDALLTELAEIGVGATILGLRRLHLPRRELVERVPAVEPAVNAVLRHVEDATGSSSELVGSIVTAVGDLTPGPVGDRLSRVGSSVAEAGPLLLRLSGLTKRD